MEHLPRAATSSVALFCVHVTGDVIEWLTLGNMSGDALSLVGWTLQSKEMKISKRLSGTMEPGDTMKIPCQAKVAGDSGSVGLVNGAGELVDVFKYDVKTEADEGESGESGKTIALRGEGGVRILSAMVNAVGKEESEKEWVVLANFSGTDVDMSEKRTEGCWSLQDGNHEGLRLKERGILKSGETIRIQRMYDARTGKGVTLSNRKGSLELIDRTGIIVDSVKYKDTKERRIVEGKPVVFGVDFQQVAAVVTITTRKEEKEEERRTRGIVFANRAESEEEKAKGFGGCLSEMLNVVVPVLVVALSTCKMAKYMKSRTR